MNGFKHPASGGLIVCLMAVALLWSSAAEALRCGNQLVTRDDSKYRVSQYCPQPFWVASWQGGVTGAYYTPPELIDRLEAWYINFGPNKQMRRLTFRNGFLETETELGYGWSGQHRDCTAGQLEAAGPTLAEVFAVCGPPDQYESWPVSLRPTYVDGFGGSNGGTSVIVFNDTWIYDFGPGARIRILEFQDGRLVRLTREPR